ncbi:hypothetical protein [Agriterribacter sp.]|uniref:hypothetical protein n=1 Tax=Agriterribacter sp. TaxID=2821509 RepID=UPI002C232978|nr:hypothetical protein [Agriterribacter sp.]HRO47716.1 hypothetical protein [Agriterribacter sp.]HRQ18069.1 hypothetical protein [Agriterribacter sp.]
MKKKFIKRGTLFLLLPFLLLASSLFIADGRTDPYYIRFTTPKQNNMIVGSSRAAQGILPSAIDSILNKGGYHTTMFNYAFTINQSPYGPTYYESIKNKLNENAKNGIFIVTVDPWTLYLKEEKENNKIIFPEDNLSLGKIKCVDCHPNFDYLLYSYSSPLLMIWMTKLLRILNLEGKESLYLHNDGWLEVSVGMDSTEVQKRIRKKIKDLENEYPSAPDFHLSSDRIYYLNKIIEFFRKHGEVFLVRIPVHEKIKDIENKVCPQFDSLMNDIARKNSVDYLNFINDSTIYEFTDGNHLYKDSGHKLSEKIGEFILNKQLQDNFEETMGSF